MVRKFALAAAICAFAMGGAQTASAVTVGPHTKIILGQSAEGSLVQQAQGGYCRRWARECADRHGWRTRDYYRCMRRHDCD